MYPAVSVAAEMCAAITRESRVKAGITSPSGGAGRSRQCAFQLNPETECFLLLRHLLECPSQRLDACRDSIPTTKPRENPDGLGKKLHAQIRHVTSFGVGRRLENVAPPVLELEPRRDTPFLVVRRGVVRALLWSGQPPPFLSRWVETRPVLQSHLVDDRARTDKGPRRLIPIESVRQRRRRKGLDEIGVFVNPEMRNQKREHRNPAAQSRPALSCALTIPSGMSGIVAGDGDQIDVRHAEKGVARRKAALHVDRSAPLTEPNVRGHSVHYAVVCHRPHRSQDGTRRPKHEVRNSRCKSHSHAAAQVAARLRLGGAVKHQSAASRVSPHTARAHGGFNGDRAVRSTICPQRERSLIADHRIFSRVIESRSYRLPAEAGAVAGPVPAAISVENVKKTFIIPDERYTSFKSRAVALFRPERHRTLAALDELSFEVQRGEFFGVVGPNGSGKSTLLKCIAGIYGTDAGCVAVTGRLSPFLEMGVGFKEEFTARENVVLNGTLLGLSPAQIRERMDGIIAFADLEQFADMNLKNFSSGMRVRLAFSLAIQVDADILLLDEVFAVGDEAFMAEVLRAVSAAQGRRPDCGPRDARHEPDKPVLRPSAAARLRADGDARRPGCGGQRLQRAQHASGGRARAGAGPPRSRSDPRHLPRRGIAFAGSGRRTTYSPSAFGDDLRRFARVTATLAKAEFQLHYRRSVLGYLWSVMQPLMLFGVLYLVFSGIVGLGDTRHYPVYVLSAVVLWTYFSEATGEGVTSLVRGAGLLRKMRFPLVAIPLSVSLKALFNLGMNGLVVVGFALASGVRPRVSWLELPLLVVLLVALTTGLTLILSTLYVRYRDTQQIWRVLERALFFCSPVFYLATQYPEAVETRWG